MSSVEKSPAYYEVRRDFDSQLDRYTLKAICGRDFVRIGKLKEWLEAPSPKRDKTHLDILLPKHHDSPQHLVSHADLIENNGLVVFIILIVLGQAEHLKLFMREEINDSQLPIDFVTLGKKIQSGVPDADSLAGQFCAAQWKFCPATFEDGYQRNYPESRILPIRRKEIINKKGATARLWQIEVLEEFVGEKLRSAVPTLRYIEEDGLGYRYHFALKCFEGKRERFEVEEIAFANLRHHEGMVKCFGNYSQTHKGTLTHNLLLEYGESDLDVYFKKRHPPFFQGEIRLFWRELFEVAKAIQGIHEPSDSIDGRTYKGWHADIKPDNILWINERFKLADPGFVKFVQDEESDPKAIVDGCTWTFSAPEHQPERKDPVLRRIDIWSFGCVLSIAATWIAGGYSAVKDFQNIRRGAIDAIKTSNYINTNVPAGDLFHDGRKVLGEVTKWHEILRGAVRKVDCITGRVLDLVDKHMMLEVPEQRMHSTELCQALEVIMDECPSDQDDVIPSSIIESLHKYDDEASSASTISDLQRTSQKVTDSSGNADERRVRKSQILGEPSKRTTHRSQYFRSVLSPADKDQTTVGTLKSHSTPAASAGPATSNPQPPRHLSSIDETITIAESKNPKHLYIARSNAAHQRQNVFQASQGSRHRKDSLLRKLWRKKDIPDGVLRRYFKERDIVFLIDNGFTMKEHWEQATFVLEALVKKAAGLDENGMDVWCTCGPENLNLRNAKDPAKFLKFMAKESVKPAEGVETDMRSAMKLIFEKHLEFLRLPTAKKRCQTLIVLTDGLWPKTRNKDEIKDKIAKFVKDVTKLRGTVIERPVSIEFVHFGGDRDAAYMLQSLDDDLMYDKNIDDVIDYEPCTGDIYKMLLGSFVEDFDRLAHEALPSPPLAETVQSIDERFNSVHEAPEDSRRVT